MQTILIERKALSFFALCVDKGYLLDSDCQRFITALGHTSLCKQEVEKNNL